MAAYTIPTDDPTRALQLIVDHFIVLDVTLVSSAYADGVLTISTSAPIDAEQAAHLDLTAV